MPAANLEKMNFDPNEELNMLPSVPEPEESHYMVEPDSYHSEVMNRVQLRRKLFLKWDVTNGFWKVGDDIIACGPNQENLIATIFKVNFPWQYWDNMELVCQNQNPGQIPQFGDWNEGGGVIVKRSCESCPKNSRSPMFDNKGGKTCKDAMQLAMSVLIRGEEKVVGFQSSNFKLIADLDDFLDSLKSKKLYLSKTTVEIGKGKAIKVNNKSMMGWDIRVLAKQPLSEYVKTLNN